MKQINKKHLIDSVLLKLNEQGAAIKLPRGASADSIMSKALDSVIEAAMDIAEEAVNDKIAERFSDKAPGDIRTENEWMSFFKSCKVAVENDDVGRSMLKDIMESPTGFAAFISSVAEYKRLVVPLLDYPGIVLFGKNSKKAEK